MIQPIGKGENTINSIFTDWEKLASEVKDINNKYDTPVEQRCNLSKPVKGGMLSANKHHAQAGIVFDSEMIAPTPDKVAKEQVDHEGTKKLSRDFDPNKSAYLQSGKSVSSVEHTAGEGQNSKYIKSESSNSIWDSEKLERLADVMDSRTKIAEEKLQQAEARKTMREQSHDDLVAALQSVDQRKSANVPSLSDSQGNDTAAFMSPTGQMSVFDFMGKDPKDFARLEEKTAGEKLSEAKAQRKAEVAEDESWKSSGKAVSSQSIADRLFDALSEQWGG